LSVTENVGTDNKSNESMLERQAHREPQWGPGKPFLRGPITTSFTETYCGLSSAGRGEISNI